MKLAIIGSRTFNDFFLAERVFEEKYLSIATEIVSGGAKGADTIGKRLAEKFNLNCKEFLPDWKKFGKSAGFKRNKLIIDYCDEVLAFWDGKSKGTKNSLEIAKKINKPILIIYP